MKLPGLLLGCATLFLFGCKTVSPLAKVLKKDKILADVVKNKEKYRVQIIYTRVDRDKDKNLIFTPFRFNVDTSRYFYPASTAKLVVSALALERFHTLFHDEVTSSSRLKAFANGPCQTNEFTDTTAENLQPSIDQYIRRMFLVSDNYAYNRVFDFLGQDYIQHRLKELGYPYARIIQRFDPACNPEANRKHNQFGFFETGDTAMKVLSSAFTTDVYCNPVMNVGIGDAYYYNDSLVHAPKQFRYNNNLPLEDLNQTLMKIIFPKDFPDSLTFKLEKQDYRFLKKYLGMYPFESDYPKYDTSYFTTYKKYIYYGRERDAVIDSNIRIYNIVGQAYGFTTDIAYIKDATNDISFFVSATIYTNEDGILNDNKYEYDAVAMPFMKALGRELYKQELKRKRK